jgi:hypothetical protein
VKLATPASHRPSTGGALTIYASDCSSGRGEGEYSHCVNLGHWLLPNARRLITGMQLRRFGTAASAEPQVHVS